MRVREWADEKLTRGDEPPWSWFQLMKLREALDGVLSGMDAVSPTGNLQRLEPPPGTRLRLVASTCLRDSAQPHLIETPVQMPM